MDVDGIWPPHEAFYIESMLWHTASARASIHVVSSWVELVRKNDECALELPRPILFEQLQNILHQAGCLSRYFFPGGRAPKSVHLVRAKHLRHACGVAADNPLAKRGLRNAIEHFDERLDEYLADESNQSGEFIPEDVAYFPRESEVPLHIFKGFYTQPMIFVLLGKSYEILPIANEILRIHEVLQASTKKGYRLLPFVAE